MILWCSSAGLMIHMTYLRISSYFTLNLSFFLTEEFISFDFLYGLLICMFSGMFRDRFLNCFLTNLSKRCFLPILHGFADTKEMREGGGSK